jgi:hypothetical protein
MKTYLISYDLIKPESFPEYIRLFSMIKTANFWAKPLRSVWLVKTTLSSAQIRDELMKVIDTNDKIMIIEVTNNWAAYGLPKEVIDWMQKGL